MNEFAKTDLKPWQRRSGEPIQAWQYFVEFRKMGTGRKLNQLSEDLGVAYSTIAGYSSDWHWYERAEAWDAAQVDAEAEAVLLTAAELAAEHMRDLAVERKLAMLALKQALEAAETGEGDPPSVQVAAGLLRDAISNERLVVGEATSREEQRSKLDLTKLSKEAREAARVLMDELGVDEI